MGAEDFSCFIAAGIPSFYFTLGGADPQKFAQAKAAGESLPSNLLSLLRPRSLTPLCAPASLAGSRRAPQTSAMINPLFGQEVVAQYTASSASAFSIRCVMKVRMKNTALIARQKPAAIGPVTPLNQTRKFIMETVSR